MVQIAQTGKEKYDEIEKNDSKGKKVVDCFTFYNELDMLEFQKLVNHVKHSNYYF